METLFSALKSLILAWFNVKLTNCVISAVLFILCVVSTFLLIWPFIQRNPYVPPPEKPRNINEGRRKHCKRNKTRTQEMVKVCRECLGKLEDVRNMILNTQRYLRKHTKMKNLSAHDLPWTDPDSDQDASTVDFPPTLSPPPAQLPPPGTYTPSPSWSTFSTSVHSLKSDLRSTLPGKCLSPSPPPCLSPPFSAPEEPDSFPPSATASSVHRTSVSTLPLWESKAPPLASTTHTSFPSLRAHWPSSSVKTLWGVGQAESPGPTLSWGEMRTKTLNLRSSSPSVSQSTRFRMHF